MWIVNHRTLLEAEVPVLRDLGYEVFVPKIIPRAEGFRSGAVTYEHDASLTLPPAALAVLNAHDFYDPPMRFRPWSPTLSGIVNEYFDTMVIALTPFMSTLQEAVRRFDGRVLARAFGLPDAERYAGIIAWLGLPTLLDEIAARGDRYAFVPGYDTVAAVEPAALTANARTVTVPLPDRFFADAGSWHGRGSAAICLCPSIDDGGHYQALYRLIKSNFGDLPHQIFGRQTAPSDDPAVLPFLLADELLQLYAGAPVYINPAPDRRHIHYSPIEAMVVGTPVLYLAGSLSDTLAGEDGAPGSCASFDEMHDKARRLIDGDLALADAVRSGQGRIVARFRQDVARSQWAVLLGASAESRVHEAPALAAANDRGGHVA